MTDSIILEPDFDAGPVRPKIGGVFLSSDQHGEAAFRKIVEGAGASFYGTRVLYRHSADSEADEDGELALAVNQILPDSGIDVLAYSCTSRSAQKGEDAMIELLENARPGIAATTPLLAARRALEALGARRVALLSPYRTSVHAAVEGALEISGFTVVRSATFDLGLGSDFARLSSDAIAGAAVSFGGEDIDAIFISCTGIRAVPVIGAVESATGRAVLTSSQTLAWHALALADHPSEGPGILFSRSLQ